MDAKTYLEQISQVTLAVKSKAEQIEALEAMAAHTSPSLDGMPSPVLHKSILEECAIKIADIKEQLQEDQKRLLEAYLEAKGIIDGLKDVRHRVLLEQRYILCKTPKEICIFMRISPRTYTNLHTFAIKCVKLRKNTLVLI